MRFNTITCQFENTADYDRAVKTLEMRGIYVWESDRNELWAEFNIAGCTAQDLAEYFGDPQLED